MTSDIDHFLTYLLQYRFFGEVVVQILSLFIHWIIRGFLVVFFCFFFFFVRVVGAICMFWRLTLPVIWSAKRYFPRSCYHLLLALLN